MEQVLKQGKIFINNTLWLGMLILLWVSCSHNHSSNSLYFCFWKTILHISVIPFSVVIYVKITFICKDQILLVPHWDLAERGVKS